MAVFRVEKTKDFTIMSNYHLRDKNLSLKAKGLLSQMLSLPEEWDYTLAGLAHINKESKDAIRTTILELEKAGYITRHQTTTEGGRFGSNEYVIRERPLPREPLTENPTTVDPQTAAPLTENPTQLNTKLLNTKYTNQSYQDNNNININNTYRCDEMDSIDKIDRKEIKAELKKQLSYENLISRNEADEKQINSIINILADVMSSRSQSIRIGGENKPLEEVIQRFKQLTDKHIAYVLECLNKNANKPRNIRAYLLTSLFNAPSTMDCYYARDADQAETKQYSFDIEEIKSLANSFSGL